MTFPRFFSRSPLRQIRSAASLPLLTASVIVGRQPTSARPQVIANSASRQLQPSANFSSSSAKMAEGAPSAHSPIVVIGSGPAGHTAAIYAARAGIATTLYEGYMALGIAAGGQLTTTAEVENYPGYLEIGGSELMSTMREQSIRAGANVVSQTVAKVDLSKRPFEYKLYPEYTSETDGEPADETVYTADSIIIATGAKARRLELPGEDVAWGNGVSACAVCDGGLPIYRDQHLAVIGGGDSACEEAAFLSKKASHVSILVRRDVMRASKANVKRIQALKNVTILYNTQATSILTQDPQPRTSLMKGLSIETKKADGTIEKSELAAKGLFYAVGHDPATSLFKGQLDMDEDGYLITQPGGITNVPGVFAAGDVQDKKYRQAITSAGTGCMTAFEAEKYLHSLEDEKEEA